MEILVLLVVILLAAFVYFLPVIIAFWRRHTYRWVIFILNIFGFLGIFFFLAADGYKLLFVVGVGY